MFGSSVIEVKGVGTASQAPDTAVMNIKISAKNKSYSLAMRDGALKVDELKKSLSDFGFNPDELKTLDFNIQPIYNYEKDYDYPHYKSTEKQVFSHFDCVQYLKFEFPFDNKKLATAVDSMVNCPATPEISLNFIVKDKDKIYEKVLTSAAKDAKRKAEILCKASGVKLGKLNSIDCSWHEIIVQASFRQDLRMYAESENSSNNGSYYNFNMNEIVVEETVEFSWEIIS